MSTNSNMCSSPNNTTGVEHSFRDMLNVFFENPAGLYEKIWSICKDTVFNRSNVLALPKANKKECCTLTNRDFLLFDELKRIARCPPERTTAIFVQLFCKDAVGPNSISNPRKQLVDKAVRKIRRTIKEEQNSRISNFDFLSLNQTPLSLTKDQQVPLNHGEKSSFTQTLCNMGSFRAMKIKSEGFNAMKRKLKTSRCSLSASRSEKCRINKELKHAEQLIVAKEVELKDCKDELEEIKDKLFDVQKVFCEYVDETKEMLKEESEKIPTVHTRDLTDPQKVDVKVQKVILYLINSCNLPQTATIKALHAVGNIVFDQNWTMKEKPKSKKRKRKSVVTGGDLENVPDNKARKLLTSLPSHSYPQKLDKAITKPCVLKSYGGVLKTAKNVTIKSDGTDNKGMHAINVSIMTNKETPEGKTYNTSHCLDMSISNATKSDTLAEHIINQFRKIAMLCSETEDELCENQKKFAEAVRFWMSDGGSEMRGAAELFGNWQASLGCNPLWILKCVAHAVLGFDSEADKLLAAIESKTNVLQIVVSDITQSFLENDSKSIYMTVAYAIFRLMGKRDDSVSYSMTKEFETYLKGHNLKNTLINIKQTRFGKIFLVGRDMAFFLGKIKNFLQNYMKDNRLYTTCVEYISSYPYLMEYSIVLGMMYYHVVLPFMRVSGIEGDCFPLSQKDLTVFMPELYDDLGSLCNDPSPLLKNHHNIPCFMKFKDKGILKFAKKDQKIFESVYNTLVSDEDIVVDLIKAVAQPICVKFKACLDRQLGKLYLRGEDSEIQKLLNKNPAAADVAPVNNLVSEHYFAVYKNRCNARLSVKPGYICDKMTTSKNPFINGLINMDDEEFKKEVKWARTSESVKRYKAFCKHLEAKEETYEKEKLQNANKRKLKAEEKRVKHLKECEELHAGPIKSLDEIQEKILNKDLDGQSKSINAEIRYQRDNIGLLATDNPRYKMKRKQFNKHVDIPLEERINNLKFLISLASDTSSTIDEASLPVNEIITSVSEIKKLYEEEVQCQVSSRSDQDILKQFSEKDIGAYCCLMTYNGKEVAVWWIGQIIKVNLSKECEECKNNAPDGNEVTGVCMRVRELKPQDEKTKTSFVLKKRSKGYHTRYEQVIKNNIDIVNKPELNEDIYLLTIQEKKKIDQLMPHCLLLKKFDDENVEWGAK